METLGEESVGFGVFGGKEDEVAGQAMAERVEAGSAFAGICAGASGVPGVLTVGDDGDFVIWHAGDILARRLTRKFEWLFGMCGLRGILRCDCHLRVQRVIAGRIELHGWGYAIPKEYSTSEHFVIRA